MSFAHKVVPENLEILQNETLLAKMKNDSDVARRVLQNEKLYGRFLKVNDLDAFTVSNVYAYLDPNVAKDLQTAHARKPEVIRLLDAFTGKTFPLDKVVNNPQPEQRGVIGCIK